LIRASKQTDLIKILFRTKDNAMTLGAEKLQEIAREYARAWTSKSPEAVASFMQQTGKSASIEVIS
jgi:hypothetical protein